MVGPMSGGWERSDSREKQKEVTIRPLRVTPARRAYLISDARDRTPEDPAL